MYQLSRCEITDLFINWIEQNKRNILSVFTQPFNWPEKKIKNRQFFWRCIQGQPLGIQINVKTWLDQMFWQIYQNLMLSGFLSSGNLCLMHHLKLFWPHAASMASDRKGVKTQQEFSWFCQKKFQNFKRKLY